MKLMVKVMLVAILLVMSWMLSGGDVKGVATGVVESDDQGDVARELVRDVEGVSKDDVVGDDRGGTDRESASKCDCESSPTRSNKCDRTRYKRGR